MKQIIEKYLEIKQNLEIKVKSEFNKEDLFKYLKENNNLELCELLFDDYLIIYFDKNNDLDINNNYEKYKKFILLFYNLLNININKENLYEEYIDIINTSNQNIYKKTISKKTLDFYSILDFIILLEIYSDKFLKIINIINLIIKYFPKFNITELEEKIIINKILYNCINEDKPYIREIFYIIIESIIIYIIDENLGILNFNEITFYEFLRDFLNIFEIIEQLYIYFKLDSHEFYNLKIISQLIKDIRNKKGNKFTKENLSQFLINIIISLKL